MRKILAIVFVLLVLIFSFSTDIYAIDDPLSGPNNQFGIHIVNENDLDEAAKLVNSSGGQWGYVTFVIREDERDTARWQRAFDRMRELKLIPIVRVATNMKDGHWEKPDKDQITRWIQFFDSLNWVVANRYVVIGNEPNHAKEWGGEIDPVGYGNYLKQFSKQLKSSSRDYFVLPAALDTSADGKNATMTPEEFFAKMLEANPDVFTYIDGWNSHSYPNPGFVGSPEDVGKTSIRNYEWEIDFLNGLGLDIDLPIFITETGWVHNSSLSKEVIADYYKKSFGEVWRDSRIVAITPFIFNYTHPPFDGFSWKLPNGELLPFYNSVTQLPKQYGNPAINNSAEVIGFKFSFDESHTPILTAKIKNTGQQNWGVSELYIGNLHNKYSPINARVHNPRQTVEYVFKLNVEEIKSGRRYIYFKDKIIGDFNLVSPMSALEDYWSLSRDSKIQTNKYKQAFLVY